MGHETNNEIDLLLRRLSRGQGATGADGDLHDHRNHLDADELSSYAENALPAAARAHYTEHLAECSRCRALVVQLSSAAGVVVAEEPSRVSAPSGLRKFLASLFSPMVLRYAVPALGLMIVAVIGLTVFRRAPSSGGADMVATSRQAETPAVAQDAKPAEGFYDKRDKSAGLVSVTPEPRRGQRNEAEPPAPIATPAAAANTPVDAVKEAPVAKAESTTVATAAPPPAAPKPAETTDEGKKREPEAQKQQEQSRAEATPFADRERDFQAGRVAPAGAATRRAAKTGALAAGENQGAGASTAQSPADKDRADGETRTVAGRRFRKQRDIWVDTAYAGGATVNLARGSEQYRSLVADEPEIKKIAEQLDGQIVVVWKGRAYKIR
jgi:outer membrane biosynthesis protein TonB